MKKTMSRKELFVLLLAIGASLILLAFSLVWPFRTRHFYDIMKKPIRITKIEWAENYEEIDRKRKDPSDAQTQALLKLLEDTEYTPYMGSYGDDSFYTITTVFKTRIHYMHIHLLNEEYLNFFGFDYHGNTINENYIIPPQDREKLIELLDEILGDASQLGIFFSSTPRSVCSLPRNPLKIL